jgi:hypothetical protein
MVQFSLATPLGIPVHDSDFEQTHRALQRTGRLRVGPRDDWHYEVRWIAPTLVRGDQPSTERLVVRRLPPPPVHGHGRNGFREPTIDRGPWVSAPSIVLPGLDEPHSLDLP